MHKMCVDTNNNKYEHVKFWNCYNKTIEEHGIILGVFDASVTKYALMFTYLPLNMTFLSKYIF